MFLYVFLILTRFRELILKKMLCEYFDVILIGQVCDKF